MPLHVTERYYQASVVGIDERQGISRYLASFPLILLTGSADRSQPLSFFSSFSLAAANLGTYSILTRLVKFYSDRLRVNFRIDLFFFAFIPR